MKITNQKLEEWKNTGTGPLPLIKVWTKDYREEQDYTWDALKDMDMEVDNAWPIPQFKKELLEGWDTEKLVKAFRDWKGLDEKLGFEGNLAKFFGLKSSLEFCNYMSKEYMWDTDDWEFWDGFYDSLYYDFEEQLPGAWDQLGDYYLKVTK